VCQEEDIEKQKEAQEELVAQEKKKVLEETEEAERKQRECQEEEEKDEKNELHVMNFTRCRLSCLWFASVDII
jgi:hypothetical protein